MNHPFRAPATRGFTLVEALVSTLLVGVVAGVLLPALTNDLAVGESYWESRLVSSGVLETQLDLVCQQAATQFNALGAAGGGSPTALLPSAFPAELQGASGTLTTDFLNPTTLVRTNGVQTNMLGAQVNVSWIIRGHTVTRSSPWYLISRVGLCENGA